MLITLRNWIGRLPLPANMLLIKALILIAVLLVAALYGRSPDRMIPLACAVPLGGYNLLHWFNIGLLAMFCTGTSVAASLPTGTMTNLNLALVVVPVLVLLWVVSMICSRNFVFMPTAANVPIILFIGCVYVSLVGGNIPWDYHAGLAPVPAQLGGLWCTSSQYP